MAGTRDILGVCRPALILALGLAVALATPGRGHERSAADTSGLPERPQRVVSMNLCTDQLAMLLAAPGQLLSVGRLAADPRSSAMAEEAARHHINHGRAEEIWLMQPDLVIAGSFSSPATLDMLRRLGVPVAVLDPARGMADIPARLREMGAILGREAAAEAAAQEFETRLAALREDIARRPRAALYYANGYTAGDRTLAGEIIATAGFDNVATEAGLSTGGHLPLEVLAMTAPEAIITGQPYPGASRSDEILDHPVVRALRHRRTGAVLTDRDWVCGTPYVLRAVAEMRDARHRMQPE